MKRIYIPIFSVSLLAGSLSAQNVWTQKANFGGTARLEAAGFSIGTKGYIGTGNAGGTPQTDFWEWDQAANTWTQKAAFGGAARKSAVGFSTGTKGYIGLGWAGAYPGFADLWEYDPTSNSWTKKADLPATGRRAATAFELGGKGYICGGVSTAAIPYHSDFWEYDPALDTWTQKLSLSNSRSSAVAFSIGTKGYVGTGDNGTSSESKDLWEWNSVTNAWTQMASFGGSTRKGAAGFAASGKGYIGTGVSGTFTSTYFKDFWVYDPILNAWDTMANFGGTARASAVGFAIGTYGYLGTGSGSGTQSDFWEYSPVFDGVNEHLVKVSSEVFPNPFSNSAQLKITSAVSFKEADMVFFNISGQEVRRTKIFGTTSIIEKGDLPNGVYFYRIILENKGVASGKLIVE